MGWERVLGYLIKLIELIRLISFAELTNYVRLSQLVSLSVMGDYRLVSCQAQNVQPVIACQKACRVNLPALRQSGR